MIKTPLFKHTFVLLLIVGLLNLVANALYLYWTTWWVDIFLHFLSGGILGMTMVLILQYFSNDSILKRSNVILSTIIFAVFVGALWEIYELYFHITYFSDGIAYITDTSSDLILDVSGAVLGAMYASKLLQNNGK